MPSPSGRSASCRGCTGCGAQPDSRGSGSGAASSHGRGRGALETPEVPWRPRGQSCPRPRWRTTMGG
eukprot:4987128-Alexandrium_andersonii.AAC.1